MNGQDRPMPEGQLSVHISQRFGEADIALLAVPMGRDLAISIFGGERPHIGAVAVAQPRPSLNDPERCSATASVIALVGHKEDMLARSVANRIAAATNRVVAVSCGIHYDSLDSGQLREIEAIVNELADRLLQSLPLQEPQ